MDSETRWDQGLDGAALRIASCEDSPLRVCAGPGTGKSRALNHRVKRLLQDGIRPNHIFLVTFTRNAAAELKHDLETLGTEGSDEVVSGTLHSFCFRSVAGGEIPGSGGRYARPMMDFEEAILRNDLAQAGRGLKVIKSMIEAFKADWARLQHEQPGWPTSADDRDFHREMIDWLMFHRAILIGELPALMRRFLELNPTHPARTTFEHVLVDEYQDLNKADQAVVDLLAQNGTLTVIGDEDQTIYAGLRHAQPESIRHFPLTHPNTRDEFMEICYRCPTTVVDMASNLIQFNRDREQRAFLPAPGNEPGNVNIVQWETLDEEVAGLASLIQRHRDRTPHPKDPHRVIDWSHIVVLTPRERHAKKIVSALNEMGIPAHSYFKEKALSTPLAQERFTLLTLLARRTDRVGLRSWFAFDHTGQAVIPYRVFRAYCEETGQDPFVVISQLASGAISIPRMSHLVERWNAFELERDRVGTATDLDLVDALFPVEAPDLADVRRLALEVLQEQNAEVDASRLLQELSPKIYSPEPPIDLDCVRVMSLHKSKGLTLHSVFLAGCNRGWLPLVDGDLQGEPARKSKDEQRRLFYVAITRCTHTLVISSFLRVPVQLASGTKLYFTGQPVGPARLVQAEPSEFMGELGPNAPRAIVGDELLRRWNE